MSVFEQRQTPPVWPDGKRVAVVIAVEHYAEYFWFALDETTRRREKTRSLGEYAHSRGVNRVVQALADFDVPATWFMPTRLMERQSDLVAVLASAGHEIAVCGREAEPFDGYAPEQQAEVIAEARDLVAELTGRPAVGFRGTHDITSETPGLLQEAGIRWSSVLRSDDRPLELIPATGDRPAVIDIPFQWELMDFPAFGFNYGPAFPVGHGRIAQYSMVLDDWKREFDAYREHGLCYVLTIEPQSMGKPGRIEILRELLAHIAACGDAWVATGAEIAEYWRAEGEPIPNVSEEVRLRNLPEEFRTAPA